MVPRLNIGLGPLLGVLAGVVLALPATASADCCLYFSTGDNDTLGRVPLTGSNPRFYWVDIAGGGSFGLAADDAHLYWGGEGTIGRVGLDGAAPTPGYIGGLTTLRQTSVAVDTGHVYWAEPVNGTIGRANLDGSAVDESFIEAAFPAAVAVDDAHVYWTDGLAGTVGRANLDGSGVDANFITGANLAGAVAVDAAHVYWTNFGADSIGRANLDGSGTVQGFIGSVDDPLGIAVDDEHVYWTDLSTGGIGRANLDGSDVDAGFIDQAGAYAVAVGPPGAIGEASRKRPRLRDGRVRIRVAVLARQRLTATARGSITLGHGKRTYPLEQLPPKMLFVRPRGEGVLRLKPKGRRRERGVAAALERGARGAAELTVRLGDNIGNHEFEQLTVPLGQ
jgi:hypothetical protein